MGMSERQDFLNWKINKGMYGWSHECAKLVDEAYERGKAAREKEGGEAVGWGPKPNKPGRYAVRGFDSSGTEALVCVAYDDDQLVCNLHDSNSDPLRKFSNLMSEISNKFEWAELYSAPLTEDADDLPIVWINPENIRRTMIASPGETVEVSAYREGEFTAPLYTHPSQSQGVPEEMTARDFYESGDFLLSQDVDACEQQAEGWNKCRRAILSTPAAPQADEWVNDVVAERKRQDEKWGGPVHDDQKSPNDFVQHIEDYAGWARVMAGMGSLDKYRRRMVQVAALAGAAIEASDRRLKRPQPPEQGG